MDLIEMPIEEARRLKYEVGRQQYGGDQFVGDPLTELHDELIDAMNYADECRRRGYEIAGMMAQLEALCLRVKAIYDTSREA